MTESAYWSFVRSGLRSKSQRWAPIYTTLNAGKRTSQSDNKRLKFEYSCEGCRGWFPRKEITIDHIRPAGTLNKKTAGQFIENLFCDSSNLQRLCLTCHTIKTNEERKNKNVKDEEE